MRGWHWCTLAATVIFALDFLAFVFLYPPVPLWVLLAAATIGFLLLAAALRHIRLPVFAAALVSLLATYQAWSSHRGFYIVRTAFSLHTAKGDPSPGALITAVLITAAAVAGAIWLMNLPGRSYRRGRNSLPSRNADRPNRSTDR